MTSAGIIIRLAIELPKASESCTLRKNRAHLWCLTREDDVTQRGMRVRQVFDIRSMNGLTNTLQLIRPRRKGTGKSRNEKVK